MKHRAVCLLLGIAYLYAAMHFSWPVIVVGTVLVLAFVASAVPILRGN